MSHIQEIASRTVKAASEPDTNTAIKTLADFLGIKLGGPFDDGREYYGKLKASSSVELVKLVGKLSDQLVKIGFTIVKPQRKNYRSAAVELKKSTLTVAFEFTPDYCYVVFFNAAA